MSNASTIHRPAHSGQQSPFRVHDERFIEVLGEAPSLQLVVATDAHEGPCYVAGEDALYFTTLPRQPSDPAEDGPLVDIKRLALDGQRFPLGPERVTVIRADANGANGMTLDARARLVVCEQGASSQPAAISRLDLASGSLERLVDAFAGRPLNSPNDVVVASDGGIWFTDPSYGYLQGFRPEPRLGEHVYRYEPFAEHLTLVASGFDKPNGIALSQDERRLYVTDSGANHEPGSFYPERPHHIRVFEVLEGRSLTAGRVFAVTDPGFPDGIKLDSAERVYASSFSGVQVFAPDGDLIGEIALPGAVNFCFGGCRRDTLFITTDTAVWAAVLNASGPPATGAIRAKGA